MYKIAVHNNLIIMFSVKYPWKDKYHVSFWQRIEPSFPRCRKQRLKYCIKSFAGSITEQSVTFVVSRSIATICCAVYFSGVTNWLKYKLTDVYNVVPVSRNNSDSVLAEQWGERSGREAEGLFQVSGTKRGRFQGWPSAGCGQARQFCSSSIHHTLSTLLMCHDTYITN